MAVARAEVRRREVPADTVGRARLREGRRRRWLIAIGLASPLAG